jgi:hypothetical protein
MGYRWPEEDLNMPKRPRGRWVWRFFVAILAIALFMVILRWPMTL